MNIGRIIRRIVPTDSEQNEAAPTPVEKANEAWRHIDDAIDGCQNDVEQLEQLLKAHESNPTSERRTTIIRTLSDLRERWDTAEQWAARQKQYDNELERIERVSRKERTGYEQYIEAFEEDEAAFLEWYFFDTDAFLAETVAASERNAESRT